MPKEPYAVERLTKVMEEAKVRRKKALSMHNKGMTLEEIGVELGDEKPLSRQRVSQMLQRARLEV